MSSALNDLMTKNREPGGTLKTPRVPWKMLPQLVGGSSDSGEVGGSSFVIICTKLSSEILLSLLPKLNFVGSCTLADKGTPVKQVDQMFGSQEICKCVVVAAKYVTLSRRLKVCLVQ